MKNTTMHQLDQIKDIDLSVYMGDAEDPDPVEDVSGSPAGEEEGADAPSGKPKRQGRRKKAQGEASSSGVTRMPVSHSTRILFRLSKSAAISSGEFTGKDDDAFLRFLVKSFLRHSPASKANLDDMLKNVLG